MLKYVKKAKNFKNFQNAIERKNVKFNLKAISNEMKISAYKGNSLTNFIFITNQGKRSSQKKLKGRNNEIFK